MPILVLAQNTRKITGQVLEAGTGQALPGATVFIDPEAPEAKEYNPAGTVTDMNGRFELVLPTSIQYVVVSFIGFEVLKVNISGKDEFIFRLKENHKQLEEVVVTGYQKIEKRKVTSAVTTVKADDIKSIGVASIDQMLEGQIAGVMASPTNGAPGAPAKMRIRSTVSLTGGTDPLWVLDGMILEGNDIPKDFGDKDNIDNLYNTSIAGVNPADIEDITILKDAAATAIYGARAANGVIVVTTKKGRAGKMRINASAGVFVTTRPDLGKLDLMNASEKVDFELGLVARKDLTFRDSYGGVNRILNQYNQKEAFRTGGFNAITPEAQSAINALRNTGTDWGKEIYQNAINQQYNLSFSGGSDVSTYYFSTGYYKEKGTTVGTGFDRLNMTLKTDMNLLKNLKLGASLFVSHTNQQGYITDADAFVNPAQYTRNVNPYMMARDENGDYNYDPDLVERDDYTLNFNMLEERENTHQNFKTLALKPMVTLDYKPWEWLNLSTQISMQLDRKDKEKMADKETYFARKYRSKSKADGQYWLPEGGVIQNWEDRYNQYQWKLQGEFHKVFAEKHDVDVMVGMEMRGDKSESIHTKGFGYDAKSMTTKPIVFPPSSTLWKNELFNQYKKSFNENRYLSYFMTASYTFANRYTFFGSMRYDGSNLFGVDRKYKYLPLWAVSGAWNINREEFMRHADWLSNLKLRVSYGIQGNVDKNTSPLIVGSWNSTGILPGLDEDRIDVSSLPNPYLRWEKTSNWNVGLDMSVLKNRISFSVDGYYRISDDLIASQELPTESGFPVSSVNWAKVTNKGVEFSLSTVNIRTKDFRWTTDFNLARNKSVVNRINVANNSFVPSLKGHAVETLFKLNTAGLDDNGLPMFWQDGQKVSFVDFFKLGEGYNMWGDSFLTSDLSTDDYRNLYTPAGTKEPKFTGGLINRFFYKGFDLTVATSFVIKQTVREIPFYDPTAMSPGQNYSRRVADIWSPENKDGIYPTLLGKNTMENNWAYLWMNQDERGIQAFKNLDIWFKERSYLRVNSIRLGYNLPEKVIRKLSLANARVSAEARNPFVWGSSYKGYFDPESYGSIYAQPQPRTFSVGLDLTF